MCSLIDLRKSWVLRPTIVSHARDESRAQLMTSSFPFSVDFQINYVHLAYKGNASVNLYSVHAIRAYESINKK